MFLLHFACTVAVLDSRCDIIYISTLIVVAMLNVCMHCDNFKLMLLTVSYVHTHICEKTFTAPCHVFLVVLNLLLAQDIAFVHAFHARSGSLDPDLARPI